MHLWEFNACVRAYNRMQLAAGKDQIALAWHTAAFTGAAFSRQGLRKLGHYLQVDKETTVAPAVTKDEFEERLAATRAVAGKEDS